MSANVDVVVEADCLQGNSKCKPKTTTSTTAYATTTAAPTMSAEEKAELKCTKEFKKACTKDCKKEDDKCKKKCGKQSQQAWQDGQCSTYTSPTEAPTTTTTAAPTVSAEEECTGKCMPACQEDKKCNEKGGADKKKCKKACANACKASWQEGQCIDYSSQKAIKECRDKFSRVCRKKSCKGKSGAEKGKCEKNCQKQASKQDCTPAAPADATTTTTAAPVVEVPSTLPETNCPMPGDAKVCHFWGDPHFTHLFFEEKLYSKILLPGSVVTLKGGNEGKYCADDGELGVRCNRAAIGGWEKFTVVDAGAGKVALKGGKDGKFCADESHVDPPRIICNRDKIGSWEKFSVVDKDGAVALRGGRADKFCADEGGLLPRIHCNRDHIGGWEKFAITVHQEGTSSWTGGDDVAQGGRQNGKGKLANFNPSGLFSLAESADGNFEAQTFFCPAYGKTTTSVAVAMRVGDDVVQMVRGKVTEPTSDDKSDKYYYTKLSPEEKENKFMKFYVNGKPMSWEELGEATGTRGEDVPDVGGGVKVGEAGGFMQQMHTTLQSKISMLPVCVGDGKESLVEVNTPWFSDEKQRVFENAVTVRMQNPAETGMCGVAPDDLGEEQRVEAKDSLFTSKQIKFLCDMCRLESDQYDICGAPNREMTAEAVCEAVGADYGEAKDACGSFDDPAWLEACALETCVGGPAATALAKLEEQLAGEGGSQQ